MKKVGLKHPVCANYSDTTGVATYSNGKVMGRAMSAAIAWVKNNVKNYSDDAVEDIDQSITGGTVTFGINELTHEIQSYTLGHQINAQGELVINELDVAPYVGFGFYGRVIRNKVSKYRALWLKKVQFGEPNDDTSTKGETIAFQSPSIVAEIMKDVKGDFKEEKLFDTEAEAIAWLEGKATVTAQCKTPQADIPAGPYAAAQTVTLTAGAEEVIYYTTNGLTPSATSGTLYSTPIEITDDAMLRAIATKSGLSNSEIANYEYIIGV